MPDRSPNYPALGLREAIQLSRKLYKEEKRSPVSAAVAVAAWGYSGVNGAARSRLSALRKYGLLEKSGGAYRLTNRALALLLNEDGSQEFLEAARSAALAPELFKALYDQYRDGSDTNLRNHLIFDRGFTEAGARHVTKAFRETIELAALGDALNDVEAAGRTEVVAATAPHVDPRASSLTEAPGRATGSEVSRVYSWPLSSQVSAELRITGQPDVRHIEMLQKYLDVVKMALESEEDASASDDESVD